MHCHKAYGWPLMARGSVGMSSLGTRALLVLTARCCRWETPVSAFIGFGSDATIAPGAVFASGGSNVIVAAAANPVALELRLQAPHIVGDCAGSVTVRLVDAVGQGGRSLENLEWQLVVVANETGAVVDTASL